MSDFRPFRCTHFLLDRQTQWTERKNANEGYYTVIWWKTIPLGEFYLSAGHELNHEHFEQKVTRSILPALKYYSKKNDLVVTTIEHAVECCQAFVPVDYSIPPEGDASVVICTKDRAESLKTCLISLQELRCRPREIIVVDNATKDESTEKTAALFPGVKYVREDRPGLDIARNTGAKMATKPIVIYTDDDTILHPLWVYHTLETFNDPSVMAMTGLVLAHEIKTEAQWIFERFWPFNRGFVDKQFDSEYFQKKLPDGPPVWEIGAGANMAFRKAVFAKAGYFDERLDVGAAGCNGDSEMWYRILAGGDVIRYNPRAVVSHFHRESLDKLQSQIYSYMRGFTAAVLFQHQRFGHKGNLKHLFLELPKYYCYLIARGFPRYRGRFTTIFSEMKGLFSGLIFYIKNRNTPSNIN